MPKCNHCRQVKSETEFVWRWKKLGIRQKTCRACRAEQNAQWYERHGPQHRDNVREMLAEKRQIARTFILHYLLEHPCVDCGETNPVVLEFDHQGAKKRAISELVAEGASVQRLQTEIAYCEVRCANCHRKKTSKDFGWFRG